jgi:hypothetical protein
MNDSLVSHILYRVPKKNHDAMLQLCKEAYDMLKQHGILHYDVIILPILFQLIKTRKCGSSQFITKIAST